MLQNSTTNKANKVQRKTNFQCFYEVISSLTFTHIQIRLEVHSCSIMLWRAFHSTYQYLLGCCWLQLGRYGFGLDCLGLMEGLKLTMKKYCILKDSAAGGTAVMVEVEEVMDG